MVETMLKTNSKHRTRRQQGRCHVKILNSQWNRWIWKWSERDKKTPKKWLEQQIKFAQQSFLLPSINKKFMVETEIRGSVGGPETDLFFILA